MRKFLVILVFLGVNCAIAQVSDNFIDGNFTTSPAWNGNTTDFMINASNQLQTKLNTINKTVYLSTPNTLAINAKWSFLIKLNLNPSTSNQVRVYLTADKEDLTAPLNGYYVLIGETGNADSYDLFKQTGSTSTRIINGLPKIRPLPNQLTANILITRNDAGVWTLSTDITGGTNFTQEGTITDIQHTTSSFFGVQCKYTRTQSNKFAFDNFLVTTLVNDVTPPTLSNFVLVGGNKIELTFNEALSITEASNPNNYKIIPGNNSPNKVTVNGANVTLDYDNNLNTGNYTLTISNIKDTKGNSIVQPINKIFFYKKPYITKFNDIVINEIFADPNPVVDLPEKEFIELWNITTEEIALKGFKYGTSTSTYTFDNEIIKPNEFVILCARADTALFKPFGPTYGITFPALTNAGSQLKLVNQFGTTIHSVSYRDTWYKDPVKKAGGYSLELIDPASLCKPSQNYSASNSPIGGTPGKVNSIYLTNKVSTPLLVTHATLKDNFSISLTFNRGLDSLQASILTHYFVNNGLGIPNTVNLDDPDFSSVDLVFNQALIKNKNYTITVKNVSDCGGKSITSQDISFFIPGDIVKNDVLINEILYDPKGDSEDFIELYNNSDKILDFKDLSIASLSSSSNEISNLKQISTSSVLFQPQSYWVITPNPDNVKAVYFTQKPSNFIKLVGMAAFVNTAGRVVVLNKAKQTIDSLSYNDKMHFPLIKDTEGVSLERSSFTQPTNYIGNFKSAAASVGFATPTYKNSQFLENAEASEEVSLASETFSPDNDGFEDVLRILYKFDKPNYVANITIYNNQGAVVKKLVRNQTLATNGELQWDGFDETGAIKLKTGIYIVYVELFNLDGDRKHFKKTAILASKF